MNENLSSSNTPGNPLGSSAAVPWPTSEQHVPVPDTSMLRDSTDAAAQDLHEGVAAAQDALHETADALNATGEAWVESVRTTVRSHPMACLAGAIAAGAVLARLMRSGR